MNNQKALQSFPAQPASANLRKHKYSFYKKNQKQKNQPYKNG